MRLCVLAVVAAGLGACATSPVSPGTNPALDKDQGLIAVGFDQGQRRIHWVVLESEEGGDDINISQVFSAKVGLSLSLYAAHAGTYCLKQFGANGASFTAQGKSDLCVTVRAGKLNYFGHVSPSVVFGQIYQTFQYEALYEELRDEYPAVFDQYASDLEKPVLNDVQNITPASVHDREK